MHAFDNRGGGAAMTSISWKKPVLLAHAHPASCELTARLSDRPGIYFFSRRFGDGDYQPFYVGRTKHIRTRLSQYVLGQRPHEARIRNVIEGGEDAFSGIQLGNGPRYFHFGYVDPKSGQQWERVTARAERALIQFGLIVGWELINNHHAGPAAIRRFEMHGSRYGELLPRTLITHK